MQFFQEVSIFLYKGLWKELLSLLQCCSIITYPFTSEASLINFIVTLISLLREPYI